MNFLQDLDRQEFLLNYLNSLESKSEKKVKKVLPDKFRDCNILNKGHYPQLINIFNILQIPIMSKEVLAAKISVQQFDAFSIRNIQEFSA